MPRQAFTAIDFETANPKRNSICQVGLVRVIKGQVVDQINVLVRPPQNEKLMFFKKAVRAVKNCTSGKAKIKSRPSHQATSFRRTRPICRSAWVKKSIISQPAVITPQR